MNDQAEKLRKIIDNLKSRQKSQPPKIVDIKKRTAKVIAVTSGKGGVGKTNITTNLAIALSEQGYKVIIIDADFGLANIDVLFGIRTQYTLADVIHNKKSILEVLVDYPESNVKFISGGSGVEDLVRLKKEQLQSFVKNMTLLDNIADVILVDTGAGLSDSVMSFIIASDEVVLVTTPEPTAITDAYALMKMVSNIDKQKNIKLIINRAETTTEAKEISDKLIRVSEKFLSLKISSLGFILNDDFVGKSVRMQKPFSISYPRSNAAKYIREISKKLLEVKDSKEVIQNKGIKGFMNRIVNFLSA